MNSIGTIAGILSVDYMNALSIVTILQDNYGKLISLIVDDGLEIQEYNYGERKAEEHYGFATA